MLLPHYMRRDVFDSQARHLVQGGNPSAYPAMIPEIPRTVGHHLVAWNSTLAAVAGYQQVVFLQDPVVPKSGGGDAQIFEPFQIAAAYGGAAANVRTHFTSASLALRGTPHVMPISGTLVPSAVYPHLSIMTANPVNLRMGENLRAEMESNSATDALVLAWLVRAGHDFSVKYRDLRWVRFTVAGGTSVTRAWTNVGTLVFEDALEGGDYAIYGMIASDANGTILAARLALPSQVYRPGCLAMPSKVSQPDAIAEGGLGLWGSFNFLAVPSLEVLDSAGAAQTFTGWILISNTLGVGADLK